MNRKENIQINSLKECAGDIFDSIESMAAFGLDSERLRLLELKAEGLLAQIKALSENFTTD
jgi:hypothetical protein